MNIVTVAEIKRNGFAALDAALALGPVHLMKRNRPSAVVLYPADYERLIQQARQGEAPPADAALQVLLARPKAASGLDGAALQKRLQGLKDSWAGGDER